MTDFNRITSSRSYFTLERSASYFFQFELVMDAIESIDEKALKILEIGGSNNILKTSLTNYFTNNDLKHCIFSLDSDPNAGPDITGDVRALDFADDSYDIIACFEVLEHMPFAEAIESLRELGRVARYFVLISVPHASMFVSLMMKVPKSSSWFLLLPVLDPIFLRFKSTGQPYSHFWEIGYRGFGLKKVKGIFESCGLYLQREFRNPLFPSHHFFTLMPREKSWE